ncbi:MAG TPA: alpha/beta hydrolase [Oscillatoriaceae cyanobacterium M33_DOE_052]|uniref:Alpha/beta hydrolase n=1 Tax=Planktothricoides sp. SpSt-374 TaxID=2282167 RepID=A0A7C3VG09_9CYAN|nr:alpha/beta hydrolase [Oscillatoriaceae cyanobacterium M33_DOE_052]
MLNQKNYLMAIPVAGIATLNIAAPVFAANQIVVKHPYKPIELVFSIAEIEDFVQTGDTNGLPEDFFKLMAVNSETLNPEEIRNQFKRPISIDPNLPLDPKSLAKNLLNMLIPPNSPEAERKAALTLMAAKGNGQILINFLKAIPGETITPDNFLQILTTYQVPAIKPQNPGTNPIDLRTWKHEGAPERGNWLVSADGTFVRQTINDAPTFFVSPDSFINTTVNGKLQVADPIDNDFIGFVFGYQSPTAANSDAPNKFNFLLFDWKKSHNHNGVFDGGHEGFALTKVDGIFSGPNYNYIDDSFWLHQDSSKFDILATDYGLGKGWRPYQEYDFTLLYQTNRIKIDVNGQNIFDISGEFEPGRFGFYNYSQSNVRYSGFTETETLPAKPVPEPASIGGLLGFSILGFRKKQKL